MCLENQLAYLGKRKTKIYLPESPFFKNSLTGVSGQVLMSVPGLTHISFSSRFRQVHGVTERTKKKWLAIVVRALIAPEEESGTFPKWTQEVIAVCVQCPFFTVLTFNLPTNSLERTSSLIIQSLSLQTTTAENRSTVPHGKDPPPAPIPRPHHRKRYSNSELVITQIILSL